MLEFLSTTPAQVVIWTTVLLVLLIVGYYIVRKFRDNTGEDQVDANELLTNFREIHQQGDISETEYRTIKAVLGDKLQSELKDNDDAS